MDFNDLSTEKFRIRMRPHALKIYSKLFPGCEIVDLRTNGCKVHILDKEFAIDSLITFRSTGQWISLQEKYRDYKSSHKFMDWTQEYKNAAGTPWETDGEWFHLGAHLYFYGWAKSDESGFMKWVLVDIPRYKLIIQNAGGLDKCGRLIPNKRHGLANFYGIHLKTIHESIIADSEHGWLTVNDPTHPPKQESPQVVAATPEVSNVIQFESIAQIKGNIDRELLRIPDKKERMEFILALSGRHDQTPSRIKRTRQAK